MGNSPSSPVKFSGQTQPENFHIQPTLHQGGDGQILAVYDLGGGTFDISILEISGGVAWAAIKTWNLNFDWMWNFWPLPLKLTASLHLETDGWETILSFLGRGLCSGGYVC